MIKGTIEEDLMVIPVVQRCTRLGVTDITWLAGIYIFNGIQLVFGIFLGTFHQYFNDTPQTVFIDFVATNFNNIIIIYGLI